ncbi:transcriptional regulator [Vibrio sp. B1REV9]|uniref:helix-turn-helix domain-containing protein n=1 Tax=Vibrio sp. B1REV9 TaxID=2751179 RepID=UPI001AFFD8C3|nr:helix-turn-helix transcriptional regulator [Vibrio sp. B1REV9]CAE6951743.1 transcriptional regulator [Vibrio sp. B1REV9]
MDFPQVRLTEKTSAENEVIQVWSKSKLIDLDKFGALFHPHRIDFCVLLFITSPTARHEVDGKVICLKQGDILLFGKQSVHRFIQESEWEGLVITVSDDYWFTDLSQKHVHHIESLFDRCTLVKNNDVNSQMLHLVDELACRKPIQFPVIKHLLVSLLLLITERKQVGHMTVNSHLYSNYLAVLKSRVALQSVEEIADGLSVSMYKLRKACISCSGKTPKQLRDEYIVAEAVRLLKYADWPISHIAEQLGFSEATNFSKFVKAKTKMSPIEIRRERLWLELFHNTDSVCN